MQKSTRNNIKILVWFIAVAAVIVMAVILITNFSKEAHAAADDSEGIQIIQSMEDAPVAPIEEHIFQMEKEEIQRKLLEDPSRTFETLTDIDTIIVGDSRVVGFAMYGFMDPSRILAGTSWSIQEIPVGTPETAGDRPCGCSRPHSPCGPDYQSGRQDEGQTARRDQSGRRPYCPRPETAGQLHEGGGCPDQREGAGDHSIHYGQWRKCGFGAGQIR